MKRVYRYIVVLLLALCLCACADDSSGLTQLEEQQTQDVKDEQAKVNRTRVSVYVCGCVKTPGVYELSDSGRICDAISAAGGITEEADAQILNQAALVTDGMRIYVPSKEETQDQNRMAGELSSNSLPQEPGSSTSGININTATKEELMTLSGIGESKAQSILDYRQENGSFSRIEDIMNIPGIKQGVFDKIKDQITV